jgi:hypothetical protein
MWKVFEGVPFRGHVALCSKGPGVSSDQIGRRTLNGRQYDLPFQPRG